MGASTKTRILSDQEMELNSFTLKSTIKLVKFQKAILRAEKRKRDIERSLK